MIKMPQWIAWTLPFVKFIPTSLPKFILLNFFPTCTFLSIQYVRTFAGIQLLRLHYCSSCEQGFYQCKFLYIIFFFKWAPIPGLIYNNTLINIQKTKVNCLYLPINLLIEILIVNITYIWENTENIQIEGKNFMAFIQQVPITIGV